LPDTDIRLLTPARVAELVGVKVETVRDWIRAGTLRAVDIRSGDRREPLYRVSEVDLLAWVEERRSK
jgi:excisionase family DNA binding protein